jgi:glycosyltransferase involved in cell wall biosynthesis
MVSVIIPAYNERERIAPIIRLAQEHADEVLVIDDGSTDGTRVVVENLGVRVVGNQYGKGYVGAIRTGFQEVNGDIVITLDADGEHDPSNIPRLISPIIEMRANLVLGKRQEIPRISERLINWLINFKVKIGDSGTGFRAMDKELALKLQLKGKCTCGILVLESKRYGATIVEVPITICSIAKERKKAWKHLWQMFYILWELVKPSYKIKNAEGR